MAIKTTKRKLSAETRAIRARAQQKRQLARKHDADSGAKLLWLMRHMPGKFWLRHDGVMTGYTLTNDFGTPTVSHHDIHEFCRLAVVAVKNDLFGRTER